MAEEISRNELYRIINRTLSKWGNLENAPIDKEMQLFYNKYNHRRQTNPQISIFEESLPSVADVNTAMQFCSDLDTYREETDVYATQTFTSSESFYRRLYNNLEYFSKHIDANNRIRYDVLRKVLQGKLPEFRNELLMCAFEDDITRIKQLRRKKDKNYEYRAIYFFNQFRNNEDIKQIESSPRKLALYKKSINIVDCLPKEKYSRRYKFLLKADLYSEIKQIATDLGEEYKADAEKAQKSIKMFISAAENTRKFVGKNKKGPLSAEERMKRNWEEYYYK